MDSPSHTDPRLSIPLGVPTEGYRRLVDIAKKLEGDHERARKMSVEDVSGELRGKFR
jgi:hypothetical protein